MPAERHLFATSHGKGPCDGIGGTVKRLATRASLQRPHLKKGYDWFQGRLAFKQYLSAKPTKFMIKLSDSSTLGVRQLVQWMYVSEFQVYTGREMEARLGG